MLCLHGGKYEKTISRCVSGPSTTPILVAVVSQKIAFTDSHKQQSDEIINSKFLIPLLFVDMLDTVVFGTILEWTID